MYCEAVEIYCMYILIPCMQPEFVLSFRELVDLPK